MEDKNCKNCTIGLLYISSDGEAYICSNCHNVYFICTQCGHTDDDQTVFCRFCKKFICDRCLGDGRFVKCEHLKCDADDVICERCADEHMEEIDGAFFCYEQHP